MSGQPDPKSGPRTVDRSAGVGVLLAEPRCAACGAPAANAHHVVQKGAPHLGDDVRGNLLPSCGSGSDGCHGAFHGSPYEVDVRLAGSSVLSRCRRDRRWVAERMGRYIARHRPDVVVYVLDKLGPDPGREFLFREYHLIVPAPE